MRLEAAVEQIFKMEPKVECTQDSMLLQIKDVASTTKSLFYVDRGNHLSPLPLSMLPPSCGYTVRSTQSSLILVAPYDGCFVALEEESYVLPLRWLGLPVRMSCPLKPSSPDPPMVTCHAAGMVVEVEWTVPVTKIKVMLNGNWEPLMVASSSCGFSVVAHPEGVVISARYAPCLEKKDGMYTLELTGDGETKISCPSLAPVLPEPPKPQPELQSEISKPQATVPQLPGFPQKPAPFNPNPAEGQEFKPFYPFFYPPSIFYSHPPASKGPHVQLPEKPVPTKLPLSERPPGPIHSPLYPYNFYARFLPQGPYRMPKPTPQPASTTAPKGQLKQPLSPLRPGATKATPQPAAPQGPLYPYPLYYQPESQSLPAKKPVPKPDLQPPISPVTKSPPKKPGQSEYQSAVKPPEGQVYHLFNSYYYPQHPQPPHSAMQRPAPLMQPLQQVTTPSSDQTSPETAGPQPGNTGIVPPHLQPGSQYTPPVYCPRFCPSGFSNCCSQIAFHQYLNIPFGFGSKDNLPVYPPLPFLPSDTSSGFDSSLDSAPSPQMPAKAKNLQSDTTPTSAPITLQSFPPGNIKQPYLQPPDGEPAALSTSDPSKLANPKPFYPYFVPNLLYPNWPYLLQKGEVQGLPQSESTPQYNIPQAPAHNPVDPMVQYKPFYVQPPKPQKGSPSPEDMNNSAGQNIMSYISQNQKQHVAEQQKPAAKELQLSIEKFSDSFESEPKKYMEHEQTLDSYSEPGSYMLLQNGPPGMVKEPLFTFEDMAGDPDLLPQNLPWQHNGKPQNPQTLKSTQGPPQLPTWLEKGLANILPGSVNYIPRTGDEVERLLLYRPPFMPLFQGPFGAEHPKTKSEDLRKHMLPLGWNPEKLSQVSGKAFPLWSSAPSHQTNGLTQQIQTEGGSQKQEYKPLSPM
ncbi:extensin-like [Mastacembelus armatus]|uniref:extensin-like n=1 Tax=Mastacembelus armatus TaxID=205130 RepID=UPI000E457B78|nr:extensin-like [Mastacembelus armatus]